MIYQITNPEGIDFYIQRLQTSLYSYLKTLWGLTDSAAGTRYDCYARAHQQWTKDNGIVPYAYVGADEYREVFFDDTKACISFFDLGSVFQTKVGFSTANVSLYFHLNLNVVKPSAFRLDENVRNDVKNFIDSGGNGFSANNIMIGEKKVLENYGGYRKRVGMKHTDMHPFHLFRIDMTYYNYSTQGPFCTNIVN